MTVRSFVTPDGCRLAYDIAGQGPVVLWQHGLGAPFEQPIAVFPAEMGVTRLTLACRGHESSDLGPLDKLSIATFTEDVLALLNHLGIERLSAAGGISLGAAISLRLAAYHRERVARLILARPAWVDQPSLATQAAYLAAGCFLEEHGAAEGLARFRSLPMLRDIEARSPDNVKSLLGYFARPRPETTIALLARLPKDWPGVTPAQLKQLALPALIIGNGEDIVHPMAYAEELAAFIPGANLRRITSKSVDATAYAAEFRAALSQFLADVHA